MIRCPSIWALKLSLIQRVLDANPHLDWSSPVDAPASLYSYPVVVNESGKGKDSPLIYELKRNYPNPFNPQTTIPFEIAHHALVSLQIFNTTGQKIRTLLYAERAPGLHTTLWDGRDDFGFDVPSGLYVCKMATEDYSHSLKMLLVR